MLNASVVYQIITELRVGTQLWVAYSGGLDSHVLLHILACLRENDPRLDIRAIHVHHGLSAHADRWSDHCLRTCQAMDIDCSVEKVKVQSLGRSLEEAARESRYRVFRQRLPRQATLLLAHHRDDQAETVLLQLLRGAGTKGLAAMPQSTVFGAGTLIRPLLGQTRADLLAYARLHALDWIEDDSNADARFDRNYLRQNIMPLLAQRWPEMSATLARSAKHCAEADALLADLASEDQLSVLGTVPGTLSITALEKLNSYRQKNVLRYWLYNQQGKMPSSQILARIQQEVLHSRPEANPQLRCGKQVIRRYGGHLYALSMRSPPNRHWQANWNLRQTLILPGVGQLSAEPVMGSGLMIPADQSVIVRFRRGGERFHPLGRCGSHPLKKLLQEWQVPPWWRDRIPLIYVKDQLVAVVGYAIAAQYSANDHRRGWRMLVEFNPGY